MEVCSNFVCECKYMHFNFFFWLSETDSVRDSVFTRKTKVHVELYAAKYATSSLIKIVNWRISNDEEFYDTQETVHEYPSELSPHKLQELTSLYEKVVNITQYLPIIINNTNNKDIIIHTCYNKLLFHEYIEPLKCCVRLNNKTDPIELYPQY